MMRGLAGRLSQALEANLGDGGGDAQGLGDLLEVAGPLIGNLRNALGGLETFWRACEGQRLLRRWPGGFEELGSRYAVGMPSRLYFKDEDGRALHPLGHQVLAGKASVAAAARPGSSPPRPAQTGRRRRGPNRAPLGRIPEVPLRTHLGPAASAPRLRVRWRRKRD
ncbi:hypothetical protein M885DRAFT_541198 [Pelagophyceae sp. CCMP2097]|nr:hypothetical protein M885DRAFT_541198 [Pelagophyceae sp. CCMP2097]